MSKGSYLYVSVALSPPLKLQLQLYLNLFHPLFWATAACISAKDTLSPLPCFLWFPPGFHIWEQAFTFPFPGTRLICDLVLPSALMTNKQQPKPTAYWWFPPGRPSRSQRSFFNTLLWRQGLCWAAWSTSAWRKGTGLRQQQQLSEEERKGLRRQKGTIALKYPDLSQNTHRGVKKKTKPVLAAPLPKMTMYWCVLQRAEPRRPAVQGAGTEECFPCSPLTSNSKY